MSSASPCGESRAPERSSYDTVIVGGGFYGCFLARHLSRRCGHSVLLVEARDHLLGRASYANQARVHAGHHYPRSLLTGYRSRVNFDRFVAEFEDCIVADFEACYAIARRQSKVTAIQFQRFCDRIGATITPAGDTVRSLMNPALVEEVFRAREFAFDAVRLRGRMVDDLRDAGVEIGTSTVALSVEPGADRRLSVRVSHGSGETTVAGTAVFNCTYSRINRLLISSGLPPIPLKHEITELALVEVPDVLERIAFTVMCGPFFSCMPFPPRGVHSLSHVRYTPHWEWHDVQSDYQDPYVLLDRSTAKSNFRHMLRDAQRYIPLLGECRYVDSLWEVKTVMPRSEIDDSRPILYRKDHGLAGLCCVTGSKIDNVYDMVEEIASAGAAASRSD